MLVSGVEAEEGLGGVEAREVLEFFSRLRLLAGLLSGALVRTRVLRVDTPLG